MRFQVPQILLVFLGLTSTTIACDLHQHLPREIPVQTLNGPHVRRSGVDGLLDRRADEVRDWTYAGQKTWGDIKPAYATCKTGKQQSPIDLLASYGLAKTHKPSFSNYDRTVKGDLFNWGFGPSYTLYTPNGLTSLPALKFDGKTVYLSGWHMHFPSEHLIAGRRSKGELHLVHVDAAGNPAAVIGILVDVGAAPSGFMGVPVIPGPDSGTVIKDVGLNMYLAIKEAGGLQNYYTYQGSLTTPACTEGLRWFVSNDKVTVTQKQMDALLQSNGGRYSARDPQKVIDQKVNQ